MAGEGRSYRDAGRLAKWAQWLLRIEAALSVLAILMVWMRGFEPQEAGPLEAGLLLLQTVLFMVLAAVTLRWIYLANANARALGATDMMVSPGWAVGWFFVPLMNLFMPYVMMRELWKASAKPSDWQMEPAPAAILLWWVLWVAAGVTGGIAFSLSADFGKSDAAPAEIVYIVSDLCLVPSLLLLAWLIVRIQAIQTRSLPADVFG
ncbi:MAG: DUF4328 domain-containing protein [Pseudomonadota bacterium]|nr:DUF4328 domain-containing protein [Pseudomonadota bacterium]